MPLTLTVANAGTATVTAASTAGAVVCLSTLACSASLSCDGRGIVANTSSHGSVTLTPA